MFSIFRAALASLFLTAALAQPLTLTNTKGVSINVIPLEVHNGSLKCKKPDAPQIFNLPVASLDAASQSAVREWADSPAALSRKFRVQPNIVKSNKGVNYDYDDRRQRIMPRVIVENAHMRKASAPAEVLMIIFANPVNSKGRLKVVSFEKQKLPSLDRSDKLELTFAPSVLTFDNHKAATHGARYYGYAVIVLVDGVEVARECHPHGFSKVPSGILTSLRARKTYDKDFGDVN